MDAIKTLGGILRSRIPGQAAPIAVTMALTYRCNLRCKYCQIWKAAGVELSTTQVCCAIDELAEAGMCRLGLTGGEPLLRDDIGAIVDHAKEHRLFCTIFTNGAFVDQHLPSLRKLDAVLISLDGPREYHDDLRGKGAFDSAFHAIQLLSAEGIKVWTNTVVTRRNLDAVDFVLGIAHRHGAHAAFQPIFEHSYSISEDKVERLRAEKSQYEQMIDFLLRRKDEGAPILNSRSSLRHLRNPNWEENPRTCLAGKAYAAVAPDGTVAPCPVLLQMEGLPDGTRVGFGEAFKRTFKPKPCHGCWCFATIEADFLFSLDPEVVGNTARYMAGEKWRQLRDRVMPGSSPKQPAEESFHASLMDNGGAAGTNGQAPPGVDQKKENES